jgi:hypothetical protein
MMVVRPLVLLTLLAVALALVGAAVPDSAAADSMMWNMGGGNYMVTQPGQPTTNLWNMGNGNYMATTPGQSPTMMWNMGSGNYMIEQPRQPSLPTYQPYSFPRW